MYKPRTFPRGSLLVVSALAIALGVAMAHATTPPMPASLAAAGAQDEGEDDFVEEDVEDTADEAEEAEQVEEVEEVEELEELEEVDEADEADEFDQADEADEVDEAGEADEADGADDQADGMDEEAVSDDPSDEAGETEDLAQAATGDDDGEWVDDYSDDSWAGDWNMEEDDPSDDAIPLDDSLPPGTIWEVRLSDADESDTDAGDSVGTGGMLPVRAGKSRPRGTAPGKPRAPARPGDDDDVVYAYGGLPVSALSVPWQAQILYPGAPAKPGDKRPAWQRQHYCGGALVAPDWVVTAAHCIDQQRVDLGFRVRLGATDISKGDGATYRIDRIVRHSQYNAESNDVSRPPNMYANDIAMVRIVPDGGQAPLAPGRVSQIPVNRKPLQGGIPVSATGWGVTGSESADAINAVMLRVDLQLMPNPVCQQRPGYGPQKIKEAVFCASNPVQSTCRGDSGGPVVLTNEKPLLVGLVSWGKRKCAGDGRPGVYTRIDRYAQWMEQAMKLPAGRNSLP